MGFASTGQSPFYSVVGMSNRKKIRINKIILELVRCFGSIDGSGLDISLRIDAEGFQDIGNHPVLDRPRVAETDPFSLEISYAVDPCIVCRDQGDRFSVNAEDSSQCFLWSLLCPFSDALNRVILFIGLRHAEIHVPRHDRVQVESRPSSCFDRSPDPVILALGVDHSGDCHAGGEVNTGQVSTADTHKDLFGIYHGWPPGDGYTCDETSGQNSP